MSYDYYDSDNIFIGSARVEVDDVSVGYTQGGVSIYRQREYEDVIIPGDVGVVDKRKLRERIFIETSFLEPVLENLQTAWDIDSSYGDVSEASSDVIKRKVSIISDHATYTFDRCVFVGEGRINYQRDAATVIPVVIEVLLGDSSAVVPEINNQSMPGLIYRVVPIKRFTEMQTFGGIRRTGASSIMDVLIEFDMPNATRTQVAFLETLFYTEFGTFAFKGYWGDDYTVFYNTYDGAEPRDGLFFVSGSFRVDLSGGES